MLLVSNKRTCAVSWQRQESILKAKEWKNTRFDEIAQIFFGSTIQCDETGWTGHL